MYRQGSFIGDGGTASVIAFEKETGIGLGRKGNSHLQKGREMLKYLEDKVSKENLSKEDKDLTNKLIESLKKVL